MRMSVSPKWPVSQSSASRWRSVESICVTRFPSESFIVRRHDERSRPTWSGKSAAMSGFVSMTCQRRITSDSSNTES